MAGFGFKVQLEQGFAEGFERAGMGVWWDATLRSGEAYDEVTEKALREAKAVVVLWSKTSVASRWVRAEATLADPGGSFPPFLPLGELTEFHTSPGQHGDKE